MVTFAPQDLVMVVLAELKKLWNLTWTCTDFLTTWLTALHQVLLMRMQHVFEDVS